METLLPSELQDFIRRHIQSVRQLEALLWLHAHSGGFFSPEDVRKGIRAGDGQVSGWLDTFTGAKILVRNDAGTHYRFSPSDPADADRVDRLAEEYKVRPRRVIDTILGKAPSS